MKTITPFALQMLIDSGRVELLDVRPKAEFEHVHASIARSIPFSQFEPHTVLSHRKLKKDAPFYIMSGSKTMASLVACSLRSAGGADPIAVDGGIEAWEGQCLPVIRREFCSEPVGTFASGLLTALSRASFQFFSLACGAVRRVLGLVFRRHRHVDPDLWEVALVTDWP